MQLALVARALHGEVAIEPAVARALAVGRAGFHVVLRVEVRRVLLGLPTACTGARMPSSHSGLNGDERRMQTEEPVEVDRRVARRRDAGRGMAIVGRIA